MTGVAAGPAGKDGPVPRVHLPTLLGRARADRGLLALAGLVVAVAAFLAGVLPAAALHAADRASAAAVAEAGDRAALAASVPLENLASAAAVLRAPDTAQTVDEALARTRGALRPVLADVLQPSVAGVVTEPFGVLAGDGGRYLQLAYVTSAAGDPRVTWIAGGPPRGSAPPGQERAEIPPGAPWTVQVGLTEEAARLLGARVGDVLQASDHAQHVVRVRVSGLYRAVDAGDAVWGGAPTLVRPRTFVDSTGHAVVDVAGLLSRGSVPDARAAVAETELRVSLSYRPRPQAFRWHDLDALREAAVVVQAGTAATGATGDTATLPPTSIRWYSALDGVLADVQARVRAAGAQAAALLAGLVAAAALVLALTAELLGRRRSAPLAVARGCGATLPGLAAELLLESVLLTAAGAGTGLLAARLLGGSSLAPTPSTALVPLLAVAALAPAITGVAAAAATGPAGPRSPRAGRAARRARDRVRRARVWALEATVALLAAGTLVALRQRGLTAPADRAAGDLLPALAPTACALACAVAARRLLHPAARLVTARAQRSRAAVPLVVSARLATGAGRLLPLAAVAVPAALLGFGAAVLATVDDGQQDVARRAVGADARLDGRPGTAVTDAARRLAGAPGVRAAVAARVEDDVALWSEGGAWPVRLVVVDAGGYARLLDATSLPGADEARRLAAASAASADAGQDRVPALLLSARPALAGSHALRLGWDGADLPLRSVGTAPAVGGAGSGGGGSGGGAEVLVLDARAAAAHGLVAPPGTVWASGPGAPAAARALAGRPGTGSSGTLTLTLRDDVRRRRAAAPLPDALHRLTTLSQVALVTFGVLGLALGAAAGAPERRATLARLRTLGLRRRAAWRLLTGELLPPALAAALAGLAAGLLLAAACLGPLGLRLVTGQPGEPVLVVPWWTALPVLAMVSSVAALVAVESAARRGDRVGLVLRAGD